MPEYIERERLLVLAKYIANMYSPTGLAAPKIIKLIERIKKADVAEVVRCKDCKYCDIGYPKKDIGKEAEVGYFCLIYRCCKKSNDFCSYGVKKEGADNG